MNDEEIRDVLRWRELAEAIAAPHGFDVDLVLAMIAQESRGRPGAFNPEPRYRWLVDCDNGEPHPVTDAQARLKTPPADFPHPDCVDVDAEFLGQQASWGLLQVMGAVARERGFHRADFGDLCDPWRGLHYGVLQLVYLRKRFGSGDDLLATYNGGPGAKGKNRGYVAAVHGRLEELGL